MPDGSVIIDIPINLSISRYWPLAQLAEQQLYMLKGVCANHTGPTMPYKDLKTQREYQSNWTKRRRLQWIQDNGPCRLCGSTLGLQVDHINSDLKSSHRIWSWCESKRLKELEKCRVLCGSCHKNKTKKEDVLRGEDSPHAKLNSTQVLEIRDRFSKGERQCSLSLVYNVSKGCIYDIVKRRKWTHI